jgi:hypothetical protein
VYDDVDEDILPDGTDRVGVEMPHVIPEALQGQGCLRGTWEMSSQGSGRQPVKLSRTQNLVCGDEKRSTNFVGIAALAYLFLLRAGHHEITPGHSWSIFQLQLTFQLRAMTNQVEHNVKVKMAKGRKAAYSFEFSRRGVYSE